MIVVSNYGCKSENGKIVLTKRTRLMETSIKNWFKISESMLFKNWYFILHMYTSWLYTTVVKNYMRYLLRERESRYNI